MSPGNRHAIQRFAWKTAMLGVFGLAQWRHGMILTFGMLFGMASMIDIALALNAKTPLWPSRLTYWDEAMVFTLMSGVAAVIATR